MFFFSFHLQALYFYSNHNLAEIYSMITSFWLGKAAVVVEFVAAKFLCTFSFLVLDSEFF